MKETIGTFVSKLLDVYEHKYKRLMLIPVLILLASLSILAFSELTTGELFERDISLKGGTTVTFYTETHLDIVSLDGSLASMLGTDDIIVREIKDAFNQVVIGYDIEVGGDFDGDTVVSTISSITGLVLNETNTDVGVQSSSIAQSFFQDALVVIAIAFILMAIVVFYYFRSPMPAFSIILSIVSDVIFMVAMISLFRIRFSIATIGALLMIIGYSTESDILLSTYILKRSEGTLMDRLKQAIKTELTMQMAAFVTFSIMLLLSNIEMVRHIALILLFGVISDTITTPLQSAGLQRIYLERKGRR